MNAAHDILDSLATAGPMTSAELREDTGRSKWQVAAALQRLVRRRKAVLVNGEGGYHWRARPPPSGLRIETLAWVDLAIRMGWGKSSGRSARPDTGPHCPSCPCVDCLGGVR